MNVHSVTELTRYIKTTLDRDMVLKNIAVSGEISNFKKYSSGHCYFTLKDATASLKCVMFRTYADRLKFTPKDGMALIAFGKISVYERDGVYQLYTENLEAQGIGALAAKFEELKERLLKEGLFDEAHKKPLPKFPLKIGVVTSKTGAVIRDIKRVTKRRNKNIQIILYPSLVQGEGAAENIAEGIKFFNENYPVDVLIVGRGGGSIEDLWAFNEEIVVRAIYNSNIPIISAVGHEVDYTLSDFAADVRAATPSQAAELAAPDSFELMRFIENLTMRLNTSARGILSSKTAKLENLMKSSFFERPKDMIFEREQRLDSIKERLTRATKEIFTQKERRLVSSLEKLDILNPARVLRRGYTMTELNGKAVRLAKDLKINDKITLVFADGKAKAEVLEV